MEETALKMEFSCLRFEVEARLASTMETIVATITSPALISKIML